MVAKSILSKHTGWVGILATRCLHGTSSHIHGKQESLHLTSLQGLPVFKQLCGFFPPPIHTLSSCAMFRSNFHILSTENELCQACFHSVAYLDYSRGIGEEEVPCPAHQAKSQPHDCLCSLRKICRMEKIHHRVLPSSSSGNTPNPRAVPITFLMCFQNIAFPLNGHSKSFMLPAAPLSYRARVPRKGAHTASLKTLINDTLG